MDAEDCRSDWQSRIFLEFLTLFLLFFREIALALELKVIPSCFQVRFKGIKGVLAIDPSLDWHVKGYKAVFRLLS